MKNSLAVNPLPFIPNQIYNRRADIHARYGGNWQSGIAPSASFPYIFIFSGSAGQQHGYQDGWDNPNVFSYTGEGQSGDMSFTKGNLALREHIANEKRVFLFESIKKGFVMFISEVECFNVDFFQTHDTKKEYRIAIRFFFKKVGMQIPVIPDLSYSPSLFVEPDTNFFVDVPNVTERKGLVTSRVGQGAYRKRIIHRWEYQCAVTGFDRLNVLIASHIVPWAEASDSERLDVNNGILLSPTYDALFDKNLISFENNGKILLSEKIELQAFGRIGVTGKESIKNLSVHNLNYLEKHRELLFNCS